MIKKRVLITCMLVLFTSSQAPHEVLYTPNHVEQINRILDEDFILIRVIPRVKELQLKNK